MRIPKLIGSLSKLTSLDIRDSGFFGEIPPLLGNLSRLQWLSHLSSIRELHIGNVNLSNAADWASTLKRLPTLSEFSCDSCSLSSISHLNFSSSLRYLDLSNNSISSSTLSCLIKGTNNLQTLILNYANLEYNLDEILKVLIKKARYSLEELSLVGNNLSKLPYEVMMFPSMTILDASFNRISGSLSEILQCLPANLTSLDLSSNLLNDVISDLHFSKFSQLIVLDLSDNILSKFNFSKSWVPPFQLRSLDLSSCKVGPSFPNWILTQNKLGDLDISNSMISDSIPDAFWHICTDFHFLQQNQF